MAQQLTGYLGNLTQQQDTVMNQVLTWVHEEGIIDMHALNFNETDILRFCRARKFDLAKVKTMLQDFAEWRRENQIDTLLETWNFPELEECKTALPNGLHKTDNTGQPIFIRQVGICDFDRFFAAATPERMISQVTWQLEQYKYFHYPVMQRLRGRPYETNCQIFDLTNGSVSKFASRNCMNLLKLGAKVAQDYYPETMGQVYVVNAPYSFVALYAVIKGFLDERTRSKVRILGSNYQPVLLENIPAENLPTFLGGTCTCSHEPRGCIWSDAGPWDDFVYIDKHTLKHKSEIEAEEEEQKQEEQSGPSLEPSASFPNPQSCDISKITERFPLQTLQEGDQQPIIGPIPSTLSPCFRRLKSSFVQESQ